MIRFATLLASLCMCTTSFAQSRVETRETTTTTTIHEYTEVIREIEQERNKPLVTAIFIKNRSSAINDQKTRVLEDMIIGEITDAGISVVSPDDTVTAMRRFLRDEDERERRTIDNRAAVPDENRLMSQGADRVLEDSTSALRLAQSMNVDYLVIASMTSYGREGQRVNRPDLNIDRTVTTHRLRTSYKILDIVRGGSETAGNILSEKRSQDDNRGSSVAVDETTLDNLLADASVAIGAQLGRKIAEGRVRAPMTAQAMVPFVITCGMQDMSVPEIVRDDNDRYVLTGNNYQLHAMAVTVELNGVVIGSAPGSFEGFPGLHRLRLTREGFEPWERPINLAKRSDGEPMVIQVAMSLDPQGYARWREMMREINKLKKDQALGDAQVDLVKGLAQMLRQSGLRIEHGTQPARDDRPSVWP